MVPWSSRFAPSDSMETSSCASITSSVRSRFSAWRSDPILTTGRQVEFRVASPPPEVRAVRDRLNLDYGKIDFSCPEGDVVVYDANKCVGTRADPGEPTRRIAAALSKGVDAWIDSGPS